MNNLRTGYFRSRCHDMCRDLGTIVSSNKLVIVERSGPKPKKKLKKKSRIVPSLVFMSTIESTLQSSTSRAAIKKWLIKWGTMEVFRCSG